ncbi:MAG: PQQ-dependent sugar dehydrogenase [Myxococcota bacterium]
MLRRWQSNAFLILVTSSLTAVACGDDDDSGAGTGGKTASGGNAGGTAKGGTAGANQGGTKSTAGGSGGSTNQGGSQNKGGSIANEAGSAGFAGGIGTGGSNGSEGGAAGAGGSGGDGDAGAGGEGGGSASLDLCRGIELPPGSHYVAPGLCVRAVATAQGKLRQLTFDSQGSLLGVTVAGDVMRYRDLNADGVFAGVAEVVKIADTGGNGNNVHLDAAGNYLYAGTPAGVRRWAYSMTVDDLGAGEDVVTGIPATGNHTYHTVHVYDGYVYVSSGSAENASAPATPNYDTNRSVLKRFALADFTSGTPLAWTAGAVYVTGIRNMVGFTRNASGRMYGVVNGIDDLLYQTQDVHLDNPGEDLIAIEAGQAHGYPYCFTASHIVTNSVVVNPGSQLAGSTATFSNPRSNEWCAENSVPPVTFLPPHSAPLDLTFFDGNLPSGGLPEGFRGGAFVALHGSWNTTPSVGHQIVFVPFDSAGNAPKPVATLAGTIFPFTVVFGGGNPAAPAAGIWGWQKGAYGETPVRFVGVAISPVDGALYVSSDNASVLNGTPGSNQGYIYRIAMQR